MDLASIARKIERMRVLDGFVRNDAKTDFVHR
jgi:hypothetical protein